MLGSPVTPDNGFSSCFPDYKYPQFCQVLSECVLSYIKIKAYTGFFIWLKSPLCHS